MEWERQMGNCDEFHPLAMMRRGPVPPNRRRHIPPSHSSPFPILALSLKFHAKMTFPVLAQKVKRFASQHILQLRHLLSGRGFSKFKKMYRLKGELGHGGFGIVYKGVRIVDGLPVAVKFVARRHIREWGKLDEHRVPMEIALLARCGRIPGVIALLDWFSLPEGFIIVMERPAPCVDLFDFIHRQKALDEDVACFLFRQIVRVVVELNERKVLHRDLKDENVLVNLASGRIKIIDFGAATLFTRNRYHDFQGTRLYCPPEWFLHSLYLGREATVWSLGVLLYNMLNGRLPFLNEKDICTAHLLGPLPFFTSLSKEVRDLLAQCLNFDTFARPSLDQILAHPWLSKCSSDWVQLSASCSMAGEGDEEEDGEAEEEEENEGEGGKRKGHNKRDESGLAASDGSCGQSREFISSSIQGQGSSKTQQQPLTTVMSSSKLLGVRRIAKTAHLESKEGRRTAKLVDAHLHQTPMYSLARAGKVAGADSMDSGTASVFHSPPLEAPNENLFAQL